MNSSNVITLNTINEIDPCVEMKQLAEHYMHEVLPSFNLMPVTLLEPTGKLDFIRFRIEGMEFVGSLGVTGPEITLTNNRFVPGLEARAHIGACRVEFEDGTNINTAIPRLHICQFDHRMSTISLANMSKRAALTVTHIFGLPILAMPGCDMSLNSSWTFPESLAFDELKKWAKANPRRLNKYIKDESYEHTFGLGDWITEVKAAA